VRWSNRPYHAHGGQYQLDIWLETLIKNTKTWNFRRIFKKESRCKLSVLQRPSVGITKLSHWPRRKMENAHVCVVRNGRMFCHWTMNHLWSPYLLVKGVICAAWLGLSHTSWGGDRWVWSIGRMMVCRKKNEELREKAAPVTLRPSRISLASDPGLKPASSGLSYGATPQWTRLDNNYFRVECESVAFENSNNFHLKISDVFIHYINYSQYFF
jgi:hypothetical protein